MPKTWVIIAPMLLDFLSVKVWLFKIYLTNLGDNFRILLATWRAASVIGR
jgi:hypothetical protein